MAKLSHLIAKLDQVKKRNSAFITEQYHLLQKPGLFQGGIKTYHPYTEGEENNKPPEAQHVQQKVTEVLEKLTTSWSELVDATYQQDKANSQAKADITVDGKLIAKDVPVTNLLYLHKILTDVVTVLGKSPTPDQSVEWVKDDMRDLLKTKETVVTQRTQKNPKVLVKAEATDKHPAQTEVYYVDEPVGEYRSTKYSGAIPDNELSAILKRAHKLRDAVKLARESANMQVTVDENDKISAGLFGYIFQPEQ